MNTITTRPVDAMVSQIRDMSAQDNGIMSLDDRLLEAFSKSAVSTEMQRDSMMNSLDDPRTVTDPAALYELQVRSSNYNLEVSMISTLARKAVSAVESLLRS